MATTLLRRPAIFFGLMLAVGSVLGAVKAWRRHQLAQRPDARAERVGEEMRLRARQAVDVAAREFDTTLDFSPDSVEDVEQVLARIHERHRTQPLTNSELVKESLRWGA